MKKNKLKIGLLSLGCPRNLVDSESILGSLEYKGYPIVDIQDCEVAIVNTCSFIDDAKTESINAILDLIDLKKEGKLKKIIAYGCLTERYKQKLKDLLPEIDAFVGRTSLNHNLRKYSLTPRHYAYLKICEGCINKCSYCIIPKIKPNFISLDMDSVLKNIERLNRNKISELDIIGQDITGYGMDLYKMPRLPELLRNITKSASDIGWIRLLYLYPSRITDDLIDLIQDEPKICKYIDLPIQHINNRILKLMHRDTQARDIITLIDKIRKRIPGVALRTSLIVGFPSETDREFKGLLKFIEDVRFEKLGVFIYSCEEDTPAHNFKGQVPLETKEERFNTIMLLQQKISQDINQGFQGKIVDVLIDEKEEKGGVYLGRTQFDAPEVDGLVFVYSKRELKAGDFVKVKITGTLEYDLFGEETLN